MFARVKQVNTNDPAAKRDMKMFFAFGMHTAQGEYLSTRPVAVSLPESGSCSNDVQGNTEVTQ